MKKKVRHFGDNEYNIGQTRRNYTRGFKLFKVKGNEKEIV